MEIRTNIYDLVSGNCFEFNTDASGPKTSASDYPHPKDEIIRMLDKFKKEVITEIIYKDDGFRTTRINEFGYVFCETIVWTSCRGQRAINSFFSGVPENPKSENDEFFSVILMDKLFDEIREEKSFEFLLLISRVMGILGIPNSNITSAIRYLERAIYETPGSGSFIFSTGRQIAKDNGSHLETCSLIRESAIYFFEMCKEIEGVLAAAKTN